MAVKKPYERLIITGVAGREEIQEYLNSMYGLLGAYSRRYKLSEPDRLDVVQNVMVFLTEWVNNGLTGVDINQNPRSYIIFTCIGRMRTEVSAVGKMIKCTARSEKKSNINRTRVQVTGEMRDKRGSESEYDMFLKDMLSTPSLSKREKEVLELLAKNIKLAEIAGIIGVSKQYVSNLAASLRTKLTVEGWRVR